MDASLHGLGCRDRHFLDDAHEFLSLPREYFELLSCVIIGECEEFHRRLDARQFPGLLDRGTDVRVSKFEDLGAVVLGALNGRPDSRSSGIRSVL